MNNEEKTALVVVDVQNDFLPGGSLAVPEGDQIIPVINNELENYDLIIFTRDYHPANHKSFASQHEGKEPFEQIDLNGLPQVLWPDHCVQETFGSFISEDIDMERIKPDAKFYIFKKGMDPEVDSYSAFFDNDRRNSTGLSEFLKEKGITSLTFCGLALDYCVLWSAEDAVKEGFNASILLNATKPIDPNFSVTSISKDIKILFQIN
jgi:nicotinamidase/pyrazinamidase